MNSEMKNTLMPASLRASREQISRWMDGDMAEHEIELAMTTLSREEGRYCWAEMHFVGDCIRGLENTPNGCAESIRAAIASEPAILAPAGKRLRVEAQIRQRSLSSAMAYIGKGGRAWATAAAVAAVGFVGTVVYKDQVNSPTLAGGVATTTMAAADGVAPTRARADLNAYLQAHQESADISSLSPMRQYMRPAVLSQAQ